MTVCKLNVHILYDHILHSNKTNTTNHSDVELFPPELGLAMIVHLLMWNI